MNAFAQFCLTADAINRLNFDLRHVDPVVFVALLNAAKQTCREDRVREGYLIDASFENLMIQGWQQSRQRLFGPF
jgi:hypothetical protein